MGQYVARRLLTAIPVLLGITAMVFLFVNMLPGDPLLAQYNLEQLGAVDLTALRHELGLDRPLPVQYVFWLGRMLRGDLGYSYTSHQPVLREISWRVLPTLELMGAALLVSVVVGVGFGILSALRHYSVMDYLLTFMSFLFAGIPEFFFSLVFMYAISVKLKLLPMIGMLTPGIPFSLGDHLGHLLLPVLVLGLARAAPILRYARSDMLDVLREDYLNTARAKGLREVVVILRHAFPNALLPLITVIFLNIPALFGGAIIVETMFQWPGMGMLYVTAVGGRDYPMIMGLALFTALIVLAFNLLADLAYAFADPRIRFE